MTTDVNEQAVVTAIAPYLKGAASHVTCDNLIRLNDEVIELAPNDTASAATIPAGMRLEFTGNATAVDIDFQSGTANALAPPHMPRGFSLWIDTEFISSTPTNLNTRGTARISVPPHEGDAVVRIFLPNAGPITITGFSGSGGDLNPTKTVPSLVIYGDSITQGWSASDPGLAWPALLGRLLCHEDRNLGFAGSARGEIQVASLIAQSQADLIVLAWGTNCWSRVPVDGALIREQMRLFIQMIRSGHPDCPIVVVSPIVRPLAEDEPNVFGATLAEIRLGIESGVAEFATRNGDQMILLIPGRDLIDESGLSEDLLHPNDTGHAAIAEALHTEIERWMPSPK